MRKVQIIRTAYSKPEIEIVHVCTDCQLMDTSYPGDHNKGNHKQGPAEEDDDQIFTSNSRENSSGIFLA